MQRNGLTLRDTQELKIKAAAAQKAKDKEASRQVVLRAPARKLAITLLKQGWRIGAPQVSIGDPSSIPPMSLHSHCMVFTLRCTIVCALGFVNAYLFFILNS